MYIKSMILDGFKSYGNRVEISGFDKEFNAITGFNGSGKSNIFDAICFVLGITNLKQVRANSLQDLVYKSGQAGVTKATVTIVFDNRNRDASPMGYEHFEEITICRQIIIGGKNKYLINGINAQNKRVQDLFCSVQLNINNPHFLIMQGRITTVLNMKPMEILSMIEEAAGTSMYENKKQAALKTIEKKENKLLEINNILTEEIGPNIAKLKQEKMQFTEYQRVERELELCKRLHIAWKYVRAIGNSQNAQKEFDDLKNEIQSKKDDIECAENNMKEIDEKVEDIRQKRDSEKDEKLGSLEAELKEAEKAQMKLSSENNVCNENMKSANKALIQLKKSIADDEKLLLNKEFEYEKVKEVFEKLKELDSNDSKALVTAQEKLQQITLGLLQNDDGENATLEQQLINAKQTVIQAETELKQSEMAINHNKEQLNKKKKEVSTNESDYKKYNRDLENIEKVVKNIENEMKRLNYAENHVENLKIQKDTIYQDVRSLQNNIEEFESRYPHTRFSYKDPLPNFNRNSVKGLVCNLLTIKNDEVAYPLELAAGGKLFNVIVDTEHTSKQLLQRGQLQQRVTLIPLNKINGRGMDPNIIQLAQKLAGEDNVHPALSLINYPKEVEAAMTWIFGQIFICKDMKAAKQVAFHPRIMKKCVTLEGDVVDPGGTLSGGAAPKSGSLLLKLKSTNTLRKTVEEKRQSLAKIENELAGIMETAAKYNTLKQNFDIKNYEANMIKQKLQQTTYHKIKLELEELEASIKTMTERIETAKKTKEDYKERVKRLEVQLKDSANIREKQLKNAQREVNELKKKAENSKNEWQKREREFETIQLEIQELKKAIETGKEQLTKSEDASNELQKKADCMKTNLEIANQKVTEIQATLKEQKLIIEKKTNEIQILLAQKEEILKQNKEVELEIKQLNHNLNSVEQNVKDSKHIISDFEKKYDWIEQDKDYFGKPGGMYNFNAVKPEETAQKLIRLEGLRTKLSRNVNARAMTLLDQEEDRYNDMMKKKKIVESDRKKIMVTIQQLDEKKKQAIMKAWEQVNKDFGSIFSSLLPGTDAKLQPPPNKTVLDGLEVKIAFSGKWKESLSELSGGQRSLVALSLILAMLLFKPAPLYILDEVDAALDLSHTENIGSMLKKHFKHSQFIIVSLKDGMFNNANVLFTTKFVDGMSTVTRAEKKSKTNMKK